MRMLYDDKPFLNNNRIQNYELVKSRIRPNFPNSKYSPIPNTKRQEVDNPHGHHDKLEKRQHR